MGITRAAAAGLAGGEPAFRRAVRSGALVRVTRDLYLPAAEAGFAARAGAVVERLGAGTYLSHESVLALHGVPLLRPPDRVYVTRVGGGAYRTAVVDVSVAPVPFEQADVVGGVPATTLARAAVDVARRRTADAAIVAIDGVLRVGVPRADVVAVADACRGFRGVRAARALVGFGDGAAESPLESCARLLFDRAGLPAPRLQVWFPADGTPRYRTDFYFEAERTVGEADGVAKYLAGPDVIRAERDRDAWFRDEGYELVHFGWTDVFQRAPEQLAARFRRAFARAHSTR